jgi:hypothetical protein
MMNEHGTKAGHSTKTGQLGVPGDIVIFPGQTLENRDCPGKTGTDGHLTCIQFFLGKKCKCVTKRDKYVSEMLKKTINIVFIEMYVVPKNGFGTGNFRELAVKGLTNLLMETVTCLTAAVQLDRTDSFGTTG